MKSRKNKPTDPNWASGPERLHKLLARAGFGSRRACEELIEEGRVTVDGDDIDTLGAKANPAENDIRVDGQRISFPDRACYLLNKPAGYICTNDDELERNTKRAIDLIHDPNANRLYTVGRLDKDSEGLILVTNDGDLTNRLTHPGFRVPKVYRVTVRGEMGGHARDQLLRGVWLDEGKTRPESIRIRNRKKHSTVLEVTLTEGRNREIRRIFAKVSHPVSRLQRVRLGPLVLGDLKAGQYRKLTDSDIDALLKAAEDFKSGKLTVKRDRPNPKPKSAGESKGGRGAKGSRGRGAKATSGSSGAGGKKAAGANAKGGQKAGAQKSANQKSGTRPAATHKPRKKAKRKGGPRRSSNEMIG